MNYYDEPDYEFDDPSEYSTEELEKAITTSTEVVVNSDMVISHIKKTVQNQLKPVLNKIIESQVQAALQNSYQSKIKLEDIIKEMIREKINSAYPDIVENKANEFAELIKKQKYENSGYYGRSGSSIHEMAEKKVKEYIENELMDSVKKSKEEIDTFAKNYFTNNLFRAMGIMTQQFNSLPETK